MKFCLDQGRTHFLKPWPECVYRFEVPAGEGDTLYVLGRGEAGDFELDLGDGHFLLTPCQPCDLGAGQFRWLQAALPAAAAARLADLRVRTAGAALAEDESTGMPVVRIAGSGLPNHGTPSYGDPALPVDEILSLLPPSLRGLRNPDWPEAWLIAQWLHSAWPYRNTRQGTSYCLWRIGDILRWGQAGKGPDGAPVIAMCVHYAVAFLQCCLALGTPARLVALMHYPNSDRGHFVAEMWSRQWRKWVLIDPQVGLCYLDDTGTPLHAGEVARYEDPRSVARCGPDYAGLGPVPENFSNSTAFDRDLFRHVGVWRWADFFTHPEHAGVGHGTTAYAETAILWLEQGGHPPMFPYALEWASYVASPLRIDGSP